jgi:calcineurin-like phosphoesterase family protein
VLVDFTNPMQDNVQSEQVEFYKDFVKWDGADLVLRDYRKKSDKVDRIIIKSEEYMKWFEL